MMSGHTERHTAQLLEVKGIGWVPRSRGFAFGSWKLVVGSWELTLP
jgi:hypothetical protein